MADEKPGGTPPAPDPTPTTGKTPVQPTGGSDRVPSHDHGDTQTKPDHTHTIDAVKFQTELVQRLAKIINDMKAQGITVPPQLIEQFKAGVTALMAAQAKPIQK